MGLHKGVLCVRQCVEGLEWSYRGEGEGSVGIRLRVRCIRVRVRVRVRFYVRVRVRVRVRGRGIVVTRGHKEVLCVRQHFGMRR